MLLPRRLEARRLRCPPPDLEDTRDGRSLLVWRERAHWIAVDADARRFLEGLDGRRPVGDQIRSRPEWRRDRRAALGLARRLLRAEVAVEEGRTAPVREGPRRRLPLESIAVNITGRCNLACPFCYDRGGPERAGEEVSAAEVLGLLDAARPLLGRRPSLLLLGGEPCLREPVLVEAARGALRRGFDTVVSTNGTAVTDGFARAAGAMGLQVQVSVDGPTAASHDALRGPGAFAAAMDGVGRLVARGVPVILSLVAHEGNLDLLEAYFDLALRAGAREARFIPAKRVGGGGWLRPAPLDRIVLAARDLFRRRPDLHRLAGRDALSVLAAACRQSRKDVSCGTGVRTLLLDADGSLYPCLNLRREDLRWGGIRDRGFRLDEAWRGSAALERVRRETAAPGGSCRACALRPWCLGGCRGEALAVGGTLDGPAADCGGQRRAIIEVLWMLAGGFGPAPARGGRC